MNSDLAMFGYVMITLAVISFIYLFRGGENTAYFLTFSFFGLVGLGAAYDINMNSDSFLFFVMIITIFIIAYWSLVDIPMRIMVASGITVFFFVLVQIL